MQILLSRPLSRNITEHSSSLGDDAVLPRCSPIFRPFPFNFSFNLALAEKIPRTRTDYPTKSSGFDHPLTAEQPLGRVELLSISRCRRSGNVKQQNNYRDSLRGFPPSRSDFLCGAAAGNSVLIRDRSSRAASRAATAGVAGIPASIGSATLLSRRERRVAPRGLLDEQPTNDGCRPVHRATASGLHRHRRSGGELNLEVTGPAVITPTNSRREVPSSVRPPLRRARDVARCVSYRRHACPPPAAPSRRRRRDANHCYSRLHRKLDYAALRAPPPTLPSPPLPSPALLSSPRARRRERISPTASRKHPPLPPASCFSPLALQIAPRTPRRCVHKCTVQVCLVAPPPPPPPPLPPNKESSSLIDICPTCLGAAISGNSREFRAAFPRNTIQCSSRSRARYQWY